MELKYARTPSGLLKIIEFVLLIIGFALVLNVVVDIKDICRFFNVVDCSFFLPWQFEMFVASTILVAILTLVAFVAHLAMPECLNPITAKIAYSELVVCVVSAILVLIASSCLAAEKKLKIYEDFEQLVAGCVFGFIAFALLLAECAFLYNTAKSVSAAA